MRWASVWIAASLLHFLFSQFQVECSLAFYAFLRTGEMTAKFSSNANPAPSVISPHKIDFTVWGIDGF